MQYGRDRALEAMGATIREILARKLREADLPPDAPFIAALADHSLARSKMPFVWNDASAALQTFIDNLDLTTEDQAQLEAGQAAFLAEHTEVLKLTLQAAGEKLFEKLQDQWAELHAHNKRGDQGFKDRLEARWGEAFGYVRKMLFLSMQEGGARHRRLGRSRAKNPKLLPHLLHRMHTRACQTVAEILALMEAGFADGAMARWRSLHEIAVVTIVIADGGEDLAERYVTHDAVAKYSAANLYQRTCQERGEPPHPEAVMEALKAERDTAIGRYEPAFKTEYGWAAMYIGNPNPKFSQLEEAAGRASARSNYKLASYNIHAGSRGLFFKLGTLDGSGLIAGASDAGFDDPGIATLETLAHINAVLFSRPQVIDQIVMLGAMVEIRDSGRIAFMEAAVKLREDHTRLQKGRRGKPPSRCRPKS